MCTREVSNRQVEETRTKSSAACCRWPCFGRRVGLDDPQRSLPTPTILWFCDSAKRDWPLYFQKIKRAPPPNTSPRSHLLIFNASGFQLAPGKKDTPVQWDCAGLGWVSYNSQVSPRGYISISVLGYMLFAVLQLLSCVLSFSQTDTGRRDSACPAQWQLSSFVSYALKSPSCPTLASVFESLSCSSSKSQPEVRLWKKGQFYLKAVQRETESLHDESCEN